MGVERMEKIRVALVGCGFFGKFHAQVYQKLVRAQIVGVNDISIASAQSLAAEISCPAFDNLDEMIEQTKPDMLDICAPDCSHLPIVLKAIERGLHFFVEKPLADSLEDCETILSHAHGFNKKAGVGFICRYDARFIAAWEEIRSGRLGDIMYMTSRRVSPIEGGLHYAPVCRLSTHSGVHDFDLARWFAASEFKTVYAKGAKGRLNKLGYDVEDAVLSTFTFENGIVYSHENTWSLPEAFPAYIQSGFVVAGTKGALEIDMNHSGLKLYSDTAAHYPDLFYWPELLGIRTGAIRDELSDFLDCICDDRTPRVGLEDGYRVSQAALAVLKSLEMNSEVAVR